MLQTKHRNYEFPTKKRKKEICPTAIRFGFSVGYEQKEIARLLSINKDSLSYTIVNSHSLTVAREDGKALFKLGKNSLIRCFDSLIDFYGETGNERDRQHLKDGKETILNHWKKQNINF